jgi:hypothetical protein
VSRKQERERREARAVEEVLDGVLANWGIDMDVEDPDILGFAFAKQIGEGEAVEYHEVYSLLRDIALESHKLGRMAAGTAAVEEELAKAEAEVERLSGIIRRTYGTQGWDIGTVKTMLLPGLDDYHSALLRQQERCGHNDTRVNRAGWVECNDCGRVWAKAPVGTLSFGANEVMLGFGEGSCEDHWWIELELYHQDDPKTTDAIVKAVLVLDDREAIDLADRLNERVREGRKDWS